MTFSESDICFRFGPEWVVYRYDTHRYYRSWNGVGLKGMDFIGILDEGTLVVMEVKTFAFALQAIAGIRSALHIPPVLPSNLVQCMRNLAQ